MTDRENESGVALISVLCLLTLFALLVGTLVAMSQTLRLSSATSDQLAKSVYRTESAANRALWLLIQDRRTFINRTVTSNADQLIVRERFRADGAVHTFEVDGTPVELTIADMNRGLSLTGYNPAAAFNVFAGYFERRPDERAELDVLRARLMDYVDSDDLLRRDGLEFADYDELKKHPLPRNTPMQYPEEALWIPGAENHVLLRKIKLHLPAMIGELFGADFLKVYRQTIIKNIGEMFFTEMTLVLVWVDMQIMHLQLEPE